MVQKTGKLKLPRKGSAKPSKTPSTAASDKKGNERTPAQEPGANQPVPLPVPTQKRILDIFERSFADLFQPGPDAEDNTGADSDVARLPLASLLQEIKAALFARDFAAAFENARPELLEAYAARWSPTRALGYAGVLAGLASYLERISVRSETTGDSPTPETQSRNLKVVSIGGGAAEVAALGGFIHNENASRKTCEAPFSASITLLDSADWSPVVAKLHGSFTTPPTLSKYASASAIASNAAFVEPQLLSPSFIKADALTLTREELSTHFNLASQQPILVTLLFTLNELYTSGGIGKTTSFLLNLTAVLPAESLLLVVDSPGSYSETTVGKESKRYPMHWLLDHFFLKQDRKDDEVIQVGCRWEKLESEDSVWFRLPESLRYPIQLENMRYQMHLYRAIKS